MTMTTTTTMKTMRRRSKQLITSRNVSRSYGGRALVRVSRWDEVEVSLRKLQSVSFDVVVRWKAPSGGSKDVTMRSPPRRARLSFLIQGLSVIREGVLLREKKIRLETGVQQVLGAFSVQKVEEEEKQNNKMMMGKYYLGEGFQRWECPVWSPLYGW